MSATDRSFAIAIALFVLGVLTLGVVHYDYGSDVMRFPALAGVAEVVGRLLEGSAVVAGLHHHLARGEEGAVLVVECGLDPVVAEMSCHASLQLERSSALPGA